MTEKKILAFKPAMRFTITTVVGNYTDILLLDDEASPFLRRFARAGKDGKRSVPFLAKHVLSLLLEVEENGEKHHIMMNLGLSEPVAATRGLSTRSCMPAG